MISKILRLIVSIIGIILSLVFIFVSFHSYFILKKTDLFFALPLFLLSGVCLIIFLSLFLGRIKFINDARNSKNSKLNILIGFCSLVISIAWFLSNYSILTKEWESFDIIGVLFFGLGGIALISKGIKQSREQKD